MKKFLATAAFIANAAVTNAQQQPNERLMSADEAKERVELSALHNFEEAYDNLDGSATIILVGQDSYNGETVDQRSEIQVVIDDTNNDGLYDSNDKVVFFAITALQKTQSTKNDFKAFTADKDAIIDVKYHENILAHQNKIYTDGAYVHKNYSNDQAQAREKFEKVFKDEANALTVIEKTFGVQLTSEKTASPYKAPQYN